MMSAESHSADQLSTGKPIMLETYCRLLALSSSLLQVAQLLKQEQQEC